MVRRAPFGFKDKNRGGKGRNLSKSSISKAMKAADSSVPGASFSDLVKADKQTQVKYDRGADLQKFVDKSKLYQEGIGLGGRVTDDGTLQMAGLRDAEGNPIILKKDGQTILSMRKPGITAVAPRNFMEALNDVKRAFTGYNTLSFDPNSKGAPTTTGGFIERQSGILDNLKFNPLSFIPGANMLMSGINTAKNIFFPPPPVVTMGGSSDITVSETPNLRSGVIETLPLDSLQNNFDITMKTKPELPSGDRLNAMDLMYDFYNLPIDQPELYG
tara:strand:+ start:3926 stop:4744 length:819 start_codon:yes stop_codon:yes gene_type:complete